MFRFDDARDCFVPVMAELPGLCMRIAVSTTGQLGSRCVFSAQATSTTCSGTAEPRRLAQAGWPGTTRRSTTGCDAVETIQLPPKK
ncbi:MAG: hypothetical protein IPG50_04695 [Myxococcales bacterium]|nr:hypothetical protein [Myxococcales bacterium]